MLAPMGDMLKLICWAVIGLFRSRVSLEVRFVTSAMCCEEHRRSGSLYAISIVRFLPAPIGLRRAL